MTRVEVTEDEFAYIAARVESFASEAAADWNWQSDFVKQFAALPLFLGWTETLGIRPDGSLIRWSTEGEYAGVRPIDRQVDVNLALIHGSRRHPKLARLVPRPPPDAIACTQCHGTGRMAVSDDPLICACGGAGWVVTAEASVHAEQIRGGRELSTREHDLIEWMLKHGSGQPQGFLDHLAVARVVSRCSCGCASIDLAVPGRRLPAGGLRIIGDFLFGDEASLCGAFVFEREGVLAGLEVYGLAVEAPRDLPQPTDLREFATGSQLAPPLKPAAG
jgi:hypothetical protein